MRRSCTDSLMQSTAMDSAAGEVGQNATDAKLCRNWCVHFVGSVKILFWYMVAFVELGYISVT